MTNARLAEAQPNIHTPSSVEMQNKALKLAHTESVRGLVILMVCFLESRLKVLICKEKYSLRECIRIATAQQLLPPSLLKNLDILREIRNVFAHEWDVDHLGHERIKPFMDSLHVEAERIMPEQRYSKGYVSNVLIYCAIDIEKKISERAAIGATSEPEPKI